MSKPTCYPPVFGMKSFQFPLPPMKPPLFFSLLSPTSSLLHSWTKISRLLSFGPLSTHSTMSRISLPRLLLSINLSASISKAQLCSLIEACFKRRKEKSLRLLEAPLQTNSSCYLLWLTCLLPTLRSQLSVSTSDDKPLPLDSLFSHLMREESTHTASSTNSVHRAATFPPVSRPSSCPHGRSKESCFTCTPSSRPVCSICKNLGKAKFLHSTNSVFCRQQRKLPLLNDSKSGSSSASIPSSFANPTPSAHLATQSLTFVVDFGATNHVVSNKDGVEIYSPFSLLISIADGTLIPTSGLASFPSNILVAPSFTQNLLSTYQLARFGYVTVFDEDKVYLAKHAVLEGSLCYNYASYLGSAVDAQSSGRNAKQHSRDV